ncbi:MAG: zinc-binding alcohol dehydrogenase family protein [Burkholderiaceae bacterium]|nr:zinc-binding alcohol dehydrogenase family protein [Burkholderiaceae bacterium]
MKAVGYYHSLPVSDQDALVDIEVPAPTPLVRDLLVRVSAVSVNPVDTLVRRNMPPEGQQARILGWDAVGIVEAVGAEVTNFTVGDRVYYAGSIVRPGSNSELHTVDERIVALAPKNLSDAQVAAMPLTTITAYELLFDRLAVKKGDGEVQTLLITGGAGGVGSMLIQLARQLTSLRIIATASRAESRQWCLDRGAHHVIDHTGSFKEQLAALSINQVDMVASLTKTQQHYDQIIDIVKPQGKIGVIDDLSSLDAMKLKLKCLSLHWEMMFARSTFETSDMAEQGKLLAEVAALVERGVICSTVDQNFGSINAANLRRAHALLESGTSRGKIVLEGWG